MKYARVNRLTNKVDKIIEAEESYILSLADYDMWLKIEDDNGGIGWVYENNKLKPSNDFYPKGYVYDANSNSYVAPVERPNDGNAYTWDEDTASWKLLV